MFSATLERPANGWNSIGPYLKADNEETAALLRTRIHPDDMDEQGRVNYGGRFFADVYHHLYEISSGLGISITVDGRVMTADELYEASA